MTAKQRRRLVAGGFLPKRLPEILRVREEKRRKAGGK